MLRMRQGLVVAGDVERAPGLAAEFEFGETQSIWRN